ncbi:hypothetical protein Pyrde_1587 [Pyrodictium delaneyi]|uniref:Uncharacterized protein n=1 Tax=Pyrodictium delaneyi TaxID=1273541 RepID=A0A0P0N4J9_9CREN|nr:hypothetical protein [Pyrodictium delaneyi]ALL01630.1 hypothetical protein Pyrde_1587 [Pyrodictium delaneyi]OWJ55134.1 hypothetical protein Pdsh_05485 [Pyrodictium delaneyi]
MPVSRKYTAYRKALEQLKLKQLDVFRYKDHDEIRVLTPDRKIVLIKLPKHREEMTIDEFVEHVKKALA